MNRVAAALLLLGLLTLLPDRIHCQTQCVNEKGLPVDWLIIYKLPKLSRTDNFLIRNGLAYAYITSEHPEKDWVISERSINDSQSLPGLLLAPLYNSGRNSLLHLLYNDDPPSKAVTLAYGHTKGVVLADQDTGYWLVHSVPNFPIEPINNESRPNSYIYPATAVRFGQSFLCVSFKSTMFDALGVQLMYNKPKVYSKNVPAIFSRYTNLTAAAASKYVKKAPWFHKTTIVSSRGTNFTSYAKAGGFNKELYVDWVAPDLGADLDVETWSNGAGDLPSSCKAKFKVFNVKGINLKFSTGAVARFKNSNDHSKWAVSSAPNSSVVCIGDINRMAAQLKRGGGTVCFKNKNVWKKYSNSIDGMEPCTKQ